MLISFLTLRHSELPHNVSLLVLTPHHILVDHQSLEPYRTPRMYLSRADAYLCAEAVSEAIREARAGIDKCPSRINATTELGSIRF